MVRAGASDPYTARPRPATDLINSVLIHPNTGNALKDHRDLATWIGRPWPLRLGLLEKIAG